jgi:hypothetical protein
MTLIKRGVIYDGCPIAAKGTIRIKDGEVSIDTMHNLMVVDGKNFAALCDGGKNEQGEVKEIDERKYYCYLNFMNCLQFYQCQKYTERKLRSLPLKTRK